MFITQTDTIKYKYLYLQKNIAQVFCAVKKKVLNIFKKKKDYINPLNHQEIIQSIRLPCFNIPYTGFVIFVLRVKTW